VLLRVTALGQRQSEDHRAELAWALEAFPGVFPNTKYSQNTIKVEQ